MLIWNPAAGRVEAVNSVREATQALAQTGWELRLETSQSGEHVTHLAGQAARESLDAVWVAGGDGTLGRAAAGLLGSATALGVLPTGTANVWAREIGLPISGTNKLAESIQRLAAGQVRAMDVGLCNGRPFLFWAGFGLDGRVVARLERHRTRWIKRWNEVYYLWTILQRSAGWRGTEMEVEADGQRVQGRFMLAVAGNIQRYAGGIARLSPMAAWDDGQIELWLFKGGITGGVRMAVRHLWNLGWQRHVKDREVLYLPFQHLRLRFGVAEWMQMDGDPWRQVNGAEIGIQAQAIRVLVP